MNYPTLEEVDNYPLPEFLTARIAKVNDIPLKYAEKLVKEAKRMLFLCSISDESVAPSDAIDLAWHEMLMFTRWYKEFSDFIGGYIHHDPTPPISLEEYLEEKEEKFTMESLKIKKTGTITYNKTKENYLKFFKENPPKECWP
jgi:hypothetical protein